jgi:integrase
MALYKRSKTWHTDFSVNGERFRQSLDTSDWREAQAKEKELIAQASAGRLAASNQQFSRLRLSDALDRHLADRSVHVLPRSHRSESDHAKPLRQHLGTLPLAQIDAETVRGYMRLRKDTQISNTTINMEIGILRRVLKRAKRWHLLADEIPRLPERRDIGRALAPEDKLRLMRIASSRPDWRVAYLASLLALNTTMRGCEIRELCWRDIDLMGRTLTIRRSKTQAGERCIPLNADAISAVLELRERAKQFFGADLSADWFVFPHAEGHSKPDPTKPMSGWRSAWRSLTKEAGLRGLRFHDLRHHAVTELAESQASDQTIMAIAGHVSPRMLAHYSHVRMDAKRQALDTLSSRRMNQSVGRTDNEGYVTDDVTSRKSEPMPLSEVLEKNGGDDGTRTRGLCRDRAAF